MPRKPFLTIMKKILFALTMLACVGSALPQAWGADMSVDFFYDNLSGGNWIDVEGYGYGWQPDVAVSDPNWRPYADGYWAYTDYGWTWISYEDFGWATYHYGRWARLADYGWVWIPGSDLDWGPAWVSWRTGGDQIGWAPLPPRGPEVVYEGQPIGARVDIEFDIGPEYYNFCDVRFIGEPVLRDRLYPPAQNVTYITNTVNVTNIYVQNNVVYNYGPDYNVVSGYSSRPIQRLTIERQAPTDLSAAARSGAFAKVQGNKLLVGAPNKLAKASPNLAPPAVKTKVAQPKIERGWAGVANKAELEQKIKTENPKNIPPPTRAAGRPGGGSPAVSGESPIAAPGERTPITPGARGKPGRVPPGATAAPAGVSPSPFERGKAHGRPGLQPGATIPPGPGEAVPPSERGKAHGRPGLQPGGTIPPGPGEVAPPSERGKAHGRPGMQPGGTIPPGAGEAVPPPERGKPHGRPGLQPGGTIPPGAGDAVPPSERGKAHGRPGAQPGGETIPPGAGEAAPPSERGKAHGRPSVQPGGAMPPSGPPPGEANGARERGQVAHGQPGGPPQGGGAPAAGGPPQRGGAPATAERPQGQPQGQGQPQRGQKKGERGTPPPGPQ